MPTTEEEIRLFQMQSNECMPLIQHQSDLMQVVMSTGGEATAHEPPPEPPLPPSMMPPSPEPVEPIRVYEDPAMDWEAYPDTKSYTDESVKERRVFRDITPFVVHEDERVDGDEYHACMSEKDRRVLQDITHMFPHEEWHGDESEDESIASFSLDAVDCSSDTVEDASFPHASTPNDNTFQIFEDAADWVPDSPTAEASLDEQSQTLGVHTDVDSDDDDDKTIACYESGHNEDGFSISNSGYEDTGDEHDVLRVKSTKKLQKPTPSLRDIKDHIVFDDYRAERSQNVTYEKAAAMGRENVPPLAHFLKDLAMNVVTNDSRGSALWWLQDVLSTRLMGWYDVGLETCFSGKYYPRLREPRVRRILGLVFYRRDTNEGKKAGVDKELFRIFGHEVAKMEMYDVDAYANADAGNDPAKAHDDGKKRWTFFRIEELPSMSGQRSGSGNPWVTNTPPSSAHSNQAFGHGQKRQRASIPTASSEPAAWQLLAFPLSAATSITTRTEVADVPIPPLKSAPYLSGFFQATEPLQTQPPPSPPSTILNSEAPLPPSGATLPPQAPRRPIFGQLSPVAMAGPTRNPLATRPIRPVNTGNLTLPSQLQPVLKLDHTGLPTHSASPPPDPVVASTTRPKRTREEAAADAATTFGGRYVAIAAAPARPAHTQPQPHPLDPQAIPVPVETPKLTPAPGPPTLVPRTCLVTSLHMQRGGLAPLMDGHGIDAHGFWLPFIIAAAGGEARIDVYTAEDEELGLERKKKSKKGMGEEARAWQKQMMEGMFGEKWMDGLIR